MKTLLWGLVLSAWLFGCTINTQPGSDSVQGTSRLVTETASLATLPGVPRTDKPVSLTDTPLFPSSTPIPKFLPALQDITVENADKVQLLQTLEIPGYQRGQTSQCGAAFSPDGHWLVGVCGKNPLPVWEVESDILYQSLYSVPLQIVDCAFDPDSQVIACGGFDNRISIWDFITGEVIDVFGENASPVWDLDFSPDGQMLFSGSLGDDLVLWDPNTGEKIWNYNEIKGFLSVSFDPSGRAVAFGNR
jgi:WD40 repeat protein